MVTYIAAMIREEIKPFYNGLLQGRKIFYLDPGNLRQLLYIIPELLLFDVVYLVRSPGRLYLYVKAFIRLDLFMPVKIIHRIVRRTDETHV